MFEFYGVSAFKAVASFLFILFAVCPDGYGLVAEETCELCPRGTYKKREVCMPCPDGYTTLGNGSNSQYDCKIGMSVIIFINIMEHS